MIESQTITMQLESQIESILFFRGEPVSKKKLSEILEVTLEEINSSVDLLKEKLAGRGIIVLITDSDVALATSPDAASIIEKITKEELSKDIGKAGLETLAIIVYKESASRREIDYIRGVNSSFILRNLSMRGLVEKIENNSSERGYIYKPSIDLLSHLGVSSIEDLPEFNTIKEEIGKVEIKEETEITTEDKPIQ